MHYDPMLAKVIAGGETRDLAIARLTAALRAFPILGIRTNIPFLLRILDDPRFRGGAMHTSFLDDEGAALADIPQVEPPAFVVAAVAAADATVSGGAAAVDRTIESWDPWSRAGGWRS